MTCIEQQANSVLDFCAEDRQDMLLRSCAGSALSCGTTHFASCSAGDALRPVILHAFGGLYLDLDVVRHTYRLPCFGDPSA